MEVLALERPASVRLCRKEVAWAVAWPYPMASRRARFVAPSAPTAADTEEDISSGHAVFGNGCRERVAFGAAECINIWVRGGGGGREEERSCDSDNCH